MLSIQNVLAVLAEAALAVILVSAPVPAPQEPEVAPRPKVRPEKPEKPLTYELVTFETLYKAAAADAAAVVAKDPTRAKYTRYLDARPFAVEHRAESKSVLDYHVNSLSRHSRIRLSREVTPWLWAVEIDRYKWDPATYEKLGPVNFYHSISVVLKTPVTKTEVRKVRKPVEKTRQVYVQTAYGQQLQTQRYTDYEDVDEEVPVEVKELEKEDVIPGPWVPAAEAKYLIDTLQTRVPVIRADNFINQTAIQEDRDGHGYYDWFGFKKLKDLEDFVRLDRKGSAEIERELGAIIPAGSVALNNRQLFRLSALTGPWWESRDAKRSRKRSNALSNFLDDFKVDAFEIVFVLPNRLPGFYLSDAKGVQQEYAPDFIAAHQESTNNDRRVHVGYTCIACHVDGGLRPFDDWARGTFDTRTGLLFGSLALDPDKADRVESVYFGPLEREYPKDVSAFAEAIGEATGGMKPAELSAAYVRVWTRYLDRPVTLDVAAPDAGYQPKDARDRLEAYVDSKKAIDPLLASFLAKNPRPLRREHFEERFGLFQLILMGASP